MRWFQLAVVVLLLAGLGGHTSSRAAPTWTWPGDLRDHMREHGVNVEGKSLAQLRAGHDYIHNITQQGTPNADDYKLLAQCPNGQCPPGWGIGGGIYLSPPVHRRPPRSVRPRAPAVPVSDNSSWPGGMVKIRVRTNQFIDEGSAVCVGYGRKRGEWVFLTAAHNLESGQIPELLIRGEWIRGTVLYRDKLPQVVRGVRAYAGRDRAVVVVEYPKVLRFRRVSSLWTSGRVALAGYPSTTNPVTIIGNARVLQNGMMVRAELNRPSRSGMSGGGLFNASSELVGIWTSGNNGNGYAESIESFVAVFEHLGWKPGNWGHVPFPNEDPVSDASDDDTVVEGDDDDDTVVIAPCEPTVDCEAEHEQLRERLQKLEEWVNNCNCEDGKTGPAGPRGPQGLAGEAGERGESGPGFIAVRVENGDVIFTRTNGEEVNAGRLYSDDESWERRVLLVNGKTGTVIDDESYGKDEPIVIDINRLNVK